MKKVKITLPSGKTKTVFIRDDQWKALQYIVKHDSKSMQEMLDASLDFYRLDMMRRRLPFDFYEATGDARPRPRMFLTK
jgi:hypothetical protein